METQFDPRQYWNKRLAEHSFSLRGTGAYYFSEDYNKFLYRLKERCLERIFASDISDLKNARILNLGCGTGFFDDWFERKVAAKIVGVDISEYAIDILAKKNPHRLYLAGDIAELSHSALRTGSYDVVTAIDVLYHIVDPDRFCATVVRLCELLRPGGYLLFTDHLWSHDRSTSQHVSWHSLPEYERILSNNGLVIQRSRSMYWLMDRYGWIGKLPTREKFWIDWRLAGVRHYSESIVMACARNGRSIAGSVEVDKSSDLPS